MIAVDNHNTRRSISRSGSIEAAKAGCGSRMAAFNGHFLHEGTTAHLADVPLVEHSATILAITSAQFEQSAHRFRI
jgi:hypothetical protein